MLYKATLDRIIQLSSLEEVIAEETIFVHARKQLCWRMDEKTGKEIICIVSIDFEHLEANNEGTLNSDGTVDVLIRFTAVLRMLRSGEELQAIVKRKGQDVRAWVNVEGVNMAVEDTERDGLIEEGKKIKVEIGNVNYYHMSNGGLRIEGRCRLKFN